MTAPTILYEDDSILVIDKPYGVVVNKAATQKDNFTIQDWLETKIDTSKIEPKDENEEAFVSRCGIVHRIDKETSGVLIVAKTIEAFISLQAQFKNREVTKKYIAIVYGKFPEGETVVDAPIARNPKNRERFAIVEEGREAKTIFNLVKYITDSEGETYSVVECEPKTGRTHQIRVHLTALNHSVLGDKAYSGKKRSKQNLEKFERQYLHAKLVTFKHPVTSKEMTIESDLPKDMQTMIDFS